MQPLKNQFPALHWEHELGLAFTKNRMNYTNKFLVIPESGDYFVYSQVTFRGTTSECGEISQGRRPNKPDSIIVVITKVTDSYPEPTQLLMGTKSVCEIGSNWFQPIYLGAMFSLNEGDKLMANYIFVTLMDCSPPGSSFHGIFQARVLEWVAFPFSRGLSQPRDRTQVSCFAGRLFTVLASREA